MDAFTFLRVATTFMVICTFINALLTRRLSTFMWFAYSLILLGMVYGVTEFLANLLGVEIRTPTVHDLLHFLRMLAERIITIFRGLLGI